MNAGLKCLLTIHEHDPRYDVEAYIFLREALEFTSRRLEKPERGTQRHVSGQELCGGFREYALEQFGPMAFTVLAEWGVHATEDIGAMVFNLVDAGELGKTAEDKPEDFAEGFSFYDAFEKPFLPPMQGAGV